LLLPFQQIVSIQLNFLTANSSPIISFQSQRSSFWVEPSYQTTHSLRTLRPYHTTMTDSQTVSADSHRLIETHAVFLQICIRLVQFHVVFCADLLRLTQFQDVKPTPWFSMARQDTHTRPNFQHIYKYYQGQVMAVSNNLF
jgi:hypothetical protein